MQARFFNTGFQGERMKNCPPDSNHVRLSGFIERSKDGYAIFDVGDTLVYCNPAYADLFYIPFSAIIGQTFEEILRHNFNANRGVAVDSGDIDRFISYANGARRSRPFRLFEVDYRDGRWFLFSEQTNDAGELLVQVKEITKQKVLERQLESTVESLRRQTLTDELTRAANRRGFVQSVENELSRCRRTGASMTMALLDLDLFKNINDTYGHQTGDKALQHVSGIIRKCLRQYDIFGRIGGEEFAIFLSNTTADAAHTIADRIREQIRDQTMESDNESIELSVSIGLSTLGCDASFEQLYTQSDTALYQAKETGRNRVVRYVE